jgi:hypothetical protein
MAVAPTDQMSRLQAEIQNLQAQLQTRPPVTKDLSLVAMVPKWSRTDKAVPLHEFFEILESTARVGNWAQDDLIRTAAMRLTDVARIFYNGALELHESDITWTTFKNAFYKRFKDVRTDQFHFTQLQSAKQRKDESPQEFADRRRSLAYKTVPKVEDAVQQKWHYKQTEKMLLASFTSGLTGQAGKFTRFNLPGNMDQALKIATTVNQAEIQERRNETFYVDEAQTRRETARTLREQHRSSNARHTSQQAGVSRTQSQNRKGVPSRNSGNRDDLKCFECGGVDHFARECLNHISRLNSSKSTSVGGRNASQGSAGSSSQEAARRPHGRRNDRNTGIRERKGSGDSTFHISVAENVAGYFMVRVQSIAGTPTIEVEISGIHSVCFRHRVRYFINQTWSLLQ